MFSRPVKGESEEDLLRIQREFLNEGKNPAATVKHSTQNAGAPGLSDELDAMCEKRPRDVVSLQGFFISFPFKLFLYAGIFNLDNNPLPPMFNTLHINQSGFNDLGERGFFEIYLPIQGWCKVFVHSYIYFISYN